MFGWLTKWSIKKWVVGFINDILEKNKDNVQASIVVVDKYIGKVEEVLAYLKSIRGAIEDNKLTNDEADAVFEEGVILVDKILKK